MTSIANRTVLNCSIQHCYVDVQGFESLCLVSDCPRPSIASHTVQHRSLKYHSFMLMFKFFSLSSLCQIVFVFGVFLGWGIFFLSSHLHSNLLLSPAPGWSHMRSPRLIAQVLWRFLAQGMACWCQIISQYVYKTSARSSAYYSIYIRLSLSQYSLASVESWPKTRFISIISISKYSMYLQYVNITITGTILNLIWGQL